MKLTQKSLASECWKSLESNIECITEEESAICFADMYVILFNKKNIYICNRVFPFSWEYPIAYIYSFYI